MKFQKFNKNSTRAKRGLLWEATLSKEFKKINYQTQNVREFFENLGVTNYYDLCRKEHKFGDLMVNTPKVTVHYECVVTPPKGSGLFPEHKVQKYGYSEFPDKNRHDYWFAFNISETGDVGEYVFVHHKVWQAYASKLPIVTTEDGKKFRSYTCSNLRSLRARKTLKETLS
jgi:hypothetical protein